MAIYGAFDVARSLVNPRTISDTQQGAMVNWLWIAGYPVANDWSYELIRKTFMANAATVRLAKLEVEVVGMPVPDPEYKDS